MVQERNNVNSATAKEIPRPYMHGILSCLVIMLQTVVRNAAFHVKRRPQAVRSASTVNAFGSVLPDAIGDTHGMSSSVFWVL